VGAFRVRLSYPEFDGQLMRGMGDISKRDGFVKRPKIDFVI